VERKKELGRRRGERGRGDAEEKEEEESANPS
jgi:hypothetical protein